MWIFLYSFFSIVLVRKKRMKKGRKWIFLIFFIWTYATHNIYIYSYCLPGKFHGQMSLVGYHPWDHKKLDTTEHQSPPTYIVLHIYTHTHTHTHTHTYTHTHTHTYTCILVGILIYPYVCIPTKYIPFFTFIDDHMDCGALTTGCLHQTTENFARVTIHWQIWK